MFNQRNQQNQGKDVSMKKINKIDVSEIETLMDDPDEVANYLVNVAEMLNEVIDAVNEINQRLN